MFFWNPIKSQAAKASNIKWQSVYVDVINQKDFIYYAKYGKLRIANSVGVINTIKNGKVSKIKIKPGYSAYGGVLTNGNQILYQYRKNVFLWSKNHSKKKICSINPEEILVARYGNNIYYGHEVDYDFYQLYKYNIKTKKRKKLPYYNAYYCYGKYLVIGGQFHEGVSTSLRLLNMKNGKVTVITKKCGYGNAVIMKGNVVYYTEYSDLEYTFKYRSYNLKTKRDKLLVSDISKYPNLLEKNFFCYTDDNDRNVYIYDVKKQKEILYKR